MTEGTRTRTALKELSIRVLSDKPLPLTGGRVLCQYGLPLRCRRVEEGEIKLTLSLEKLREMLRFCAEPEKLVELLLEELSYLLPEAVLTVVKVYADGVKVRELSYLEETTPVGRGILIDEERDPEKAVPPWARENREKLFHFLREVLLLELIYAL